MLGSSARYAADHPHASGLEKFKPHLYFNLGRIVSYFILGGLIGLIGSVFQLSTSIVGVLTVAVGMVMLILGGQLIEILPVLKRISFTLPKSISRRFGLKDQNPALMGAATFFLPCGFTQAMQLYAMSTGSPMAGALTMGVFALGTAPGLLGVGGLTAAVKGQASRLFFRSAGVVVVLLSIFNITNGLNLLGVNPFTSVLGASTASAAGGTVDPNVTLENGVQVVRMQQTSAGYTPNRFTIKNNLPVKWIVDSRDSNTCAASIVSQQLGIRRGLKFGENIFEFTPAQTGTIRFSCSMGMYTGVFNVVDGSSAAVAPARQIAAVVSPGPASAVSAGSCGGGGGCGCGGGVKKAVTATTGEVVTQGQVQVLKAVYTQDKDLVPNQFTVKAGQPVRFEIEARDDGYGCMGSITLPGLTNQVEVFTKGQTISFAFTPDKAGIFRITCAMGVPRGQIQVN